MLLHVACDGWNVCINDLAWHRLRHPVSVVELGVNARRVNPELLECLLRVIKQHVVVAVGWCDDVVAA